MPYLIVVLVIATLVIAFAWRGAENMRNGGGQRPTQQPPRRPQPPQQRRFIAPDDDPEFLSEIDRRLRGEDKSN